MKRVQKTVRIRDEVVRAIQEMAEATGRDFSAVANELLTEGVKMRRCPGIIFGDGPGGRRARIAGTGLDVWEIVATYKSLGGDLKRLRDAYHWLTESQLRAALGYYACFPEEIDRQISRNEAWTRDRLERQHPALSPEHP
jgi:uncharacterized protein (DUF433 family)